MKEMGFLCTGLAIKKPTQKKFLVGFIGFLNAIDLHALSNLE